MTTPDTQTIKERIAALKEQQPTFTTPDGNPMPSMPTQPKPAQFRKQGLIAQAKELSLSDDAKHIDDLVNALPMQEAVNLWGKPQNDFKRVGGNTVLIRCPKPEHPDHNPSASCDIAQGLWHCHGCQEGGDKYALAALHHGIADYQSGKNFVDLKHKIAADLGYTITETAGTTTLTPPTPPQPAFQPVDLNAVNPAPPAPAVQPLQQLDDGTWYDPATGEIAAPAPAPVPSPTFQPVSFDDIEDEPELRIKPQLDWLPVGKNRSFIDTYMKSIERDEYPEAFAFASALLCLSFVAGRNVTLEGKRKVRASLGVVTVAGTGIGKTRALNDAKDILEEVMPWKKAEIALMTGGHIVPGSGVIAPAGVGSGENLIRQFEDILKVPNGTNADGTPAYTEERFPVNGLINFEELSQFVGKASATGSTLRERVFSFLDTPKKVESMSNTAGSYRAVKPFACMYTSVQPGMIHELLNSKDEHSGQINRLLFFTGDQKAPDHTDLVPIDLGPAVKALQELKAFWGGLGDTTITYERDALLAMDHYQRTVSAPLEQSGNGMMGRLRLTFWKFLILICVNEQSTVVTKDIIGKAIHLHQYIIETYKYVSGELYDPTSVDRKDRPEDKILDRVKRVGDEKKKKGAQTPTEYGLTATEIRKGVIRHFDVFSSPTQALNRTIEALVETGALTKHQGQRGSRYTLPE